MDLDFKEENSFWVSVRSVDPKTGNIKENGRVRLSLDIYQYEM
jgi:hypothetical protein